jgi:hypothetical protein
MTEDQVRTAAQDHAEGTVQGDMKRAGAHVDPSAYGSAGEVMKKMPGTLSGCEVVSVTAGTDSFIVRIRYDGDGGSLTVDSTWAEKDSAPKIVGLAVA